MSLATCGTAMVIRKQNGAKTGRRKQQISSNNKEENGNHTKETQHGQFQIPPVSEPGKKVERNGINDLIEPRRDEISVVVFNLQTRKDITGKLKGSI